MDHIYGHDSRNTTSTSKGATFHIDRWLLNHPVLEKLSHGLLFLGSLRLVKGDLFHGYTKANIQRDIYIMYDSILYMYILNLYYIYIYINISIIKQHLCNHLITSYNIYIYYIFLLSDFHPIHWLSSHESKIEKNNNVLGRLSRPGKLTRQWKNKHSKMISYETLVIFHCHASLLEQHIHKNPETPSQPLSSL